MANTFPDYELINKGGISLSANFELLKEAPLDARLVVPSLEGLEHLITGKAAYAGMIVYVTSESKHYQVNADGTYRQFGLTSEELNEIITDATTAAMEFKGATSALPESGVKGDMYKVSGAFEVSAEADAQGVGFTTQVGDSIVYDGEKWYLIPSGDDIEDTWRPVTDVASDASLTFVDGDKIDAVVSENGTIKFNHEKLSAAPADVATEEDKKTRTYLTAVEVDEFGHVTNYKTATENVEDTDTTYEFECQVEEGHSNVHFSVKASDAEQAQEICLDAYTRNEVDDKIKEVQDAVDVIEAKPAMGISSDDITNWANEIGAKEIANAVTGVVNTNKSTWDLAGTAVQTETFNSFKNENAQAIANAVAPKLDTKTFTDYIDGKEMSDEDLKKYADDAVTNATKDLGSMSTKDAADYYTKNDIDGKDFASKAEAQGYATTAQTNAEVKAAELDAALKTELTGVINGVDAKFASYVTSAAYSIDKSNLDNIDSDHETRIQTIEAKFGEGEGTVEDQISKAVDAEKSRAMGIEAGLRTDVNDALTRVKAIEDAPYVTKEQLDGVDAKFASYTTTEAQQAIDKAQDDRIKVLEDNRVTEEELADAIKDFETKENVAKVAQDLADYETSNNAALAGVKETAEAAVTDAKLATALEPYAKSADVETKTDAAAKLAEAKKYTDDAITTANLSQYTTEQEVKDIVDGVINTATDKETLDSLVELVEYIDTHSGDAINMATAIGVLEGKVDGLEKAPAAGISATDISNWNNEIGAKELASTKTTTAEVKDQIEAYKYATDVNAQKYATDAQAAAEGTAHNELEAYKLVVTEELNKKQNNIPENTYDAYGSAAKALEDANSYTNTAIQGLDVTDTEVVKQFVTAVSETDGKVAVSRRALVKGDIPTLDRHQVNQWDYAQNFEKSSLNPDGGDLNGYLEITVYTNHWDHFSPEFLITDNTFWENHTCGNFLIHSTWAGMYEGAYTSISGDLVPSHYSNKLDGSEITIWVPIWAQNVNEGDSITVCCKDERSLSVSYVSSPAEGALPTKARYQGTNGIKVSYDTEYVNIGLDSNTTFIFDCGNASN